MQRDTVGLTPEREQAETSAPRAEPPVPAAALLALQRTAGNQAVAALVARTHVVQQRAGGALVQRQDHDNPTSASIAKLMSDSGITSFGPYVWDDTVPRFKLNPAYSGWTIADCVSTAVHEPETKAVAGEKGNKQSLITTRRAKALAAVFGSTQGVATKIMEHSNGTTPRPFTDLATEDGHCGGHTAQRHILGEGVMTGHRQVALRAAFWRVNGIRMDLDPAGTASVFESSSVATAAVKAALKAGLETNWDANRKTLAKGTQIKINVPCPVQCVAYTKKDDPKGTPYAESEMPKYLDPSKSGDRELYPGDHTTEPDPPDKGKDPLTTGGAVTYPNMYVIVDPNPSYPGGWAVYTAYPKQ